MGRRNVSGTVADPTIRFSKLEIAGQSYRLAYSFNAVAEAEHVAKCNLLEGLENLEGLTALQFRGLLYAALSVAHPDITIEQAGCLVGVDTETRLMIGRALAEAYKLSMPDRKADPPAASAPAES